MCARASVLAPLAYSYGPAPYLSHTILQAPLTYQQVSPNAAYAAPLPAPVAYTAAHFAAPIATPIAYAAPAVVATKLEPTYTAINRGAIHSAPLPGHSESTSAVNLEPAPGTL